MGVRRIDADPARGRAHERCEDRAAESVEVDYVVSGPELRPTAFAGLSQLLQSNHDTSNIDTHTYTPHNVGVPVPVMM